MVIKHRGRRFKRSSAKSNGAVVIKPAIHSPSQVRPNKPKEEELSARLNGRICSVVHLICISWLVYVCNYPLDVRLTEEGTKPPSPALFKSGIFSLPPAEPPLATSRGRPPSAKGRSRPNSRSFSYSPTRRVSRGPRIEPVMVLDGFHKLQPLPAIGSVRQNHTVVGEHSISDDSAIEMSSNYSSSLETTSSPHLLSSNTFVNMHHMHEPMIKARKSLQEEHSLHRAFRVSEISETLPSKLSIEKKRRVMPPEPSSEEPNCVLLAIKLPDGTRLERRFRQTDLLTDVMLVAQRHCPQPLSACELSTNDVPKRVFTDHGMTLQEAGLSVRTMLILSEL